MAIAAQIGDGFVQLNDNAAGAPTEGLHVKSTGIATSRCRCGGYAQPTGLVCPCSLYQFSLPATGVSMLNKNLPWA